ncbi:adenine phosphoribosyltransferase 5-like isoform X2 [Tripterygium wilfordii]|uniref:adenine phosphoribosyltransferase 5-like isoform X2 n=1 Tax=Tripterygium wilfordii TaxID=458696 RepID=UPI0018F80A43|nr:adenine phosphoribosyltransferase 5-like isoform X2 [Tripterygium wilfordii]
MYAAENGLKGDPRLEAIHQAIRVVPDFPKPGIMFQDITTLLLDHKVFKATVDIFVYRYRDMGISVVAETIKRKRMGEKGSDHYYYLIHVNYIGKNGGIEARGFMFGPSIALAIGAKFVPLRKPRKLPGKVISEAYELEYGTDCLEMHIDAVQPGERALVIDDLVATGGTLSAAIRLLERVGAEVVECACVIGLPEVKGHCRLNGKPVYILVEPRLVDNCCRDLCELNELRRRCQHK